MRRTGVSGRGRQWVASWSTAAIVLMVVVASGGSQWAVAAQSDSTMSRWSAASGVEPGSDSGGAFDAARDALDDFHLRMNAALSQANQACAESIGITSYRVTPLLAQPSRVGWGRFGIDDVEVAARSGYMPDYGGAVVDTGDDDRPEAGMSADEREAFFAALFGEGERIEFEVTDLDGNPIGGGILGDGCLSRFYEKFFGSTDRYVRFTQLSMSLDWYAGEAYASRYSDPAFVDVVAEWAECMAAAGIEVVPGPYGPEYLQNGDRPVDGPDVDRGEPSGWPEPRPSPLEIQTAVADVECREAVDFVARATAIDNAQQQAVADRIALSEIDAELREIYRTSGTTT